MKTDSSATAYSYLRFSSPEQAKGDSLRRQVAMCDDWCRRNGVRLDTTYNLRDEGISAFTGDHRQNPDRHALAAFLELVRMHKIPKGSFLVIENLDRLSREDAVPALSLFTGILGAGIRIVQLDPEAIYHQKSDSMDIMRAVLELSRGNSESKNKSRRMRAVWAEKRKQAVAGKGVLSRACPAWIRVEGDGADARYVLIPERGRVVNRIFREAIDGRGARLIVKGLVADQVEPFGRGPWSLSYVKVILRNRAAYGEFTPRTRTAGEEKKHTDHRKNAGPAVKGYYPAAISEQEFYAAAEAGKARRVGGRPPTKQITNVFAGLLFDARDGGRLHIRQYSQADGSVAPSLAPYERSQLGRSFVSFPLAVFEAAVFQELREIDPKELLPASDGGADEVLALAGRLADVEGRLTKIRASIRAGAELDTLLDVVRDLEQDRKAVADELDVARRKAASPVAEAWAECGSLLATLKAAPDPEAARVRLRGAVRRIVESVWCLFLPGRGRRYAAVQIWFTGGGHRDYIIRHDPKRRGAVKKAGQTEVLSFTDAGVTDADLRDPKAAAVLEKLLTKHMSKATENE